PADLAEVSAHDDPLLERQLPSLGRDPRAEEVVRRRQENALHSERACEAARDARERLAATQRLRADEVQAEIAVAEREPRLAAELLDRPERVPRLVRAGPAPALVGESGERADERVEIGR